MDLSSKTKRCASESLHSSGTSTRVRISPEPSYLARLGVVWAYPLRLTIVTELYMREMSVTEFFREFGGGSLGNVRWHFQVLAEHGWLRKVRRKKVGRGRPQDIYRSTELAYYDDECAEELPASVRAAFSVRILQQMGERIASAKRASTLCTGKACEFWLDTVLLDEKGWLDSIAVLNGCLRALAQEQLDAKVRIAATDEHATLMMVCLAGFESPRAESGPHASRRQKFSTAPVMKMQLAVPLETRLAKVFADPVNLRIVRELNEDAMSPSGLALKIDGFSVGQLDRKCKHLEKYGWIARVEERTGGARRGAREVFYRGTRPPLSLDLWPEVAKATGPEPGAQTLHDFHERVVESIRAGILDSRHNRYLVWSALLLDEPGWCQVLKLLGLKKKELIGIQRQSGVRLRKEKQPGFQATFFSAAFEIPPFNKTHTV